jgi:hypothetical protein
LVIKSSQDFQTLISLREGYKYYHQIIKEVINFNITHQDSTYDKAMIENILSIIKQSFLKYHDNCTYNSGYNWEWDNCFTRITGEIKNRLTYQYYTQWSVLIGVLNLGGLRSDSKNNMVVLFNNLVDITVIEHYPYSDLGFKSIDSVPESINAQFDKLIKLILNQVL